MAVRHASTDPGAKLGFAEATAAHLAAIAGSRGASTDGLRSTAEQQRDSALQAGIGERLRLGHVDA